LQRLSASLLLALIICAPCQATVNELIVADPFLELHTGPGRGYPVFYVVERGQQVTVVKRRTQWIQIRTERGRVGWAHVEQLTATLAPDGEPLRLEEPGRREFHDRRWEVGVLAGDFGGASVISMYGGYAFNTQLSAELAVSQVLGDFSDGWLIAASLVHVFVPEWRIAPYFSLGTGVVNIEPRATIVQAEDRTDQVGIVGGGLRAYLTRRFMFRAEYKSYVVFTSRDDNEEVDEWKAGFAFFF